MVIINYGMGNIQSIYRILKNIDKKTLISDKKNEINAADKLILPGVGHFKKAVQNMKELDIWETINRKVIVDKIPIFGICLGVQLMAKYSEEGDVEGFGWINAGVVRFMIKNKLKYKIPHMGWNDVKVINCNTIDGHRNEHGNESTSQKYYFVHSYHLVCNEPSDVWMTTDFEYEFVSAIHHDNIYGTQFHPEKSYNAGYKLLKGFAAL